MKNKGTQDVSSDLKTQVAHFLLEDSKNGKPFHGKIKEAATKYNLHRCTISSIWTAAKVRLEHDGLFSFTSKRGLQNRKLSHLDVEKLTTIPSKQRSTLRRLAKSMNVCLATAHRWVKRGQLKPHTNAIKSDLTAETKMLRLKFSLSTLQVDRLVNKIKFASMHNVIHIDEKWFHITQECERYYISTEEVEPHRTCKNKNYITKVMFMCDVGRPWYSSDGTILFDGKIGMYPFINDVAAIRNNKNRPKGTLEPKPIQSIAREVTRNCLITQMVPDIKAKWPANASKNIWIQQDNAKPHISNNDPEWRAAATSDGFNIQLICQPTNSPDTNVNDLGWFRALQALQVETSSYNVDDLIKNVLKSFENLEDTKLNKVFLSLQACLIEIMQVKGRNNYKVPHQKKDHQIREGRLPMCLEVDEMLVRECIHYIQQNGNDFEGAYDLKSLMSDLGY